MPQDARLFAITNALDAHRPRTGAALAAQLGVSVRTIYRDMDRLTASGVPIEGTRGAGYTLAEHALLAPMTLTKAELEALNLGLAIAAELADTALAEAAASLAAKVDAAQPSQSAPTEAWAAPTPFSTPARGFSHLAPARTAIEAKQKLRLTYTDETGTVTDQTVRPLKLSYWGRIWALTAWNERSASFARFRLDLIETLEPLPELFSDTPGKRLQDAEEL